MARSLDIASIEPSDGILTDQIRRKINGNFTRLAQYAGTERPASQASDMRAYVSEFVEEFFKDHLEEMLGEAQDRAFPVGSVIVTTTSDDPRLARGTWQQVGQGRYVRAAGGDVPVMSEGGSSELEITADNIPAHSHSATAVTTVESAGNHTHEATVSSSGNHSHTGTAASAGSHSHSGTASSGGAHTHGASTGSAGNHSHTISTAVNGSHSHTPRGGWGAGSYGDGYFRVNDNSPKTLWSNTYDAGSHSHGASSSFSGPHTHGVTVNSGGAHTHGLSVNSAGSHTHSVSTTSVGSHSHAVDVKAAGEHSHQATTEVTIGSAGGSAEPLPVSVEPEYISLLFYRRVA